MRDPIPGPRGHNLTWRQTLNHWATQAPLFKPLLTQKQRSPWSFTHSSQWDTARTLFSSTTFYAKFSSVCEHRKRFSVNLHRFFLFSIQTSPSGSHDIRLCFLHRHQKKKTKPKKATNLFFGVPCLEAKHTKKKTRDGYSHVGNKINGIAQDN